MNPSKHKMAVLSQIFKLIPCNLIPKLAKECGITAQDKSKISKIYKLWNDSGIKMII